MPNLGDAHPVGVVGAVVCLLLAAAALSNDWWFAGTLLVAGAAVLFGWALWVGGSGRGKP